MSFITIGSAEKTKFSIPVILQVILGSLFLAGMSQIAIPLPFAIVPMTLQTLGVSLLAVTLGSRKATAAVVCYLVQATIGLPVLAGGLSNPLWILTPRTGYFLAFIVVAFLLGKIVEWNRNKSFIVKYASMLFCGDLLICILGASYLSLFLGLEKAFLTGFIPFIPGACIKALVATTSIQPVQWVKNRIK